MLLPQETVAAPAIDPPASQRQQSRDHHDSLSPPFRVPCPCGALSATAPCCGISADVYAKEPQTGASAPEQGLGARRTHEWSVLISRTHQVEGGVSMARRFASRARASSRLTGSACLLLCRIPSPSSAMKREGSTIFTSPPIRRCSQKVMVRLR